MSCQSCTFSGSLVLQNSNNKKLVPNNKAFKKFVFVGSSLPQQLKSKPLSSSKVICGALATPSPPVDGGKKTSNPWWTRDPAPNMIDINSVQELVDVLACNSSQLVILDFYASWCNACRALYPKLVKLCKEHPDIVVAKVNWEENRDISKAFGIKVLPYFQFYYGSHGKVAQFSASVSKIQRLKDAIAEHSTPRCQIVPVQEPVLEEFPDVHAALLPAGAISLSGNVVTFDKFSGLNEESEEGELAFA
eukprot:TRINITY_DN9733_c0_g1_i1.p2 TRINITY_DN9733_c0_g1~~TRINITY_DN9733_c0_g1_i1.p2  ORF type:complete len:289 (-),score=41.35 TRINITY_DN9733_c0_g1_i1:1532-2275(-)